MVLAAVWDFWFADYFRAGGHHGVGGVASAALEVVKKCGDVALANCGCLCEEAMAKVLSMKSVTATGEVLFLALRRWIFQPVSVGAVNRTIAARRLINHLSLQKMAPSFLLDVAFKSGFVSRDVVFDAFESRALQWEAENDLSSVTRAERSLPNWHISGTPVIMSLRPVCLEFLDRALERGCWS